MTPKRRVSAVSYLNTSPLVWGMAHGPQRGVYELHFTLPAECAEELRSGAADIGLVPTIELARQPDLTVIPGSAIACQGPVRSILLVSKKPMDAVESFAADTSSRTSVVLTQIVLARKYGIRPRVRPYPPKLNEMLELADAALIIGDPALRMDPEISTWRGQPVHVYDVGGEWVEMTERPMVYAVWAAKNLIAEAQMEDVFNASKRYGLERVDEIVERESAARDFSEDLVRRYVTQHISYDLGQRERESIGYFLRAAGELALVSPGAEVNYLDAAAVGRE